MAVAEPWYRKAADWLMRGLLAAHPVALAGFVLGGAVAACGLELFVRQIFGR